MVDVAVLIIYLPVQIAIIICRLKVETGANKVLEILDYLVSALLTTWMILTIISIVYIKPNFCRKAAQRKQENRLPLNVD